MAPGDQLQTRLSLIHALQAHDIARRERAWRDFLSRYEQYLRGCVVRLGVRPGDIDEATSVILSRMVQAVARFDEERLLRPGGFRAWLRSVARNAVVDWLRHRGRRPDVAEGGDNALEALLNVPEEVSSICDEVGGQMVQDAERLEQIAAAARRVREQVEPHVWEAFYLRDVEGLETAEVAQRLGIDTPNNVNVYCLRVRRRLRQELERAAAGG